MNSRKSTANASSLTTWALEAESKSVEIEILTSWKRLDSKLGKDSAIWALSWRFLSVFSSELLGVETKLWTNSLRISSANFYGPQV